MRKSPSKIPTYNVARLEVPGILGDLFCRSIPAEKHRQIGYFAGVDIFVGDLNVPGLPGIYLARVTFGDTERIFKFMR